MKPTVIAGGSGDNAHSNPAANNNNSNNGHPQDGDNNNYNSHGSRAFPHFQSGFGDFGPSMVDDIFSDDDFRPHTTSRMRDPWGFGARKRCGNFPKEDPYRRYFADKSDLFPGFQDDPEWNTMRGRRRVAPQPQTSSTSAEPRSHVFDYIPAHFRSYMPDEFGFSSMRPKASGPSSPSNQSQSYPGQRTDAQTQHTQAPQPKFCDASIQTEDNINAGSQDPAHDQNLNQHGFRNTVDMGQKSPQEESPEPRAQSAPPINEANQNFATSAASSYAGPDDSKAYATSYASTGTNPRTPQQSSAPNEPAFTQQQRPHPNNAPPPPQRHHIPQYQSPPQYYQQQQQQAPPKTNTPSNEEGSGFVRHVPIFIEGRSDPVNPSQRKTSAAKTQPQEHHPHRPTPLNTQQAQSQAQTQFNDAAPTSPNRVPHTPQTPHTTESINKIQSIQRDVLNLMTKVEQFAGAKRDKEYMYLDEMLTRNLLKLDTIDTNGKDSIRLARREAIKCIQASINVLEAKAEGNAKTIQQSVMEVEAQAAAQIEAAAEAEPTLVLAADAEPTPVSAAEPLDVPCNEEPKEDIVVEPLNDDPKDNLEKLEPEAQDQQSTEPAPIIVEETKSLEPPKEPTEKSSVVLENKPPASPKKKIVRKVKKSEKKDLSAEASPAPKEAEVTKAMEVESSEGTNQTSVVNAENADKQ